MHFITSVHTMFTANLYKDYDVHKICLNIFQLLKIFSLWMHLNLITVGVKDSDIRWEKMSVDEL